MKPGNFDPLIVRAKPLENCLKTPGICLTVRANPLENCLKTPGI